MFEWVRAIHDAFNLESTWAFALVIAFLFASVAGIGGGAVAVVVDRAYKKAEERRLLELQPGYVDPYVVAAGTADCRMDTLDQDLRKVGIPFTSMSSPQLKPSPENDGVPQEYFQLKNSLYLRAQWRDGTPMPPDKRALAERVILAHEARLKVK